MNAVAERATVFGERRRRAERLASQFAFASEPMKLAAALAAAQERAYLRAVKDRPSADVLVGYVVRVAVPEVVAATMSAGTEPLREAVLLRFHEGDLDEIVRAWLDGDPLPGTDVFLARAATSAVLEAVPAIGAAFRQGTDDERHCPACYGLPQLAVFTETGEALVTGRRLLVCSRCATEWTYARMTCVSCRETDGSRLPVFADESLLPHLRIDACDTCRAYLVTVDVRKEPGAVPLVDEIAALPLDLLAAERGYKKISRNVMGF